MTELASRHRELLKASAISPEVIAARGYFTVERKTDVGKLGFGPSLQYAPTLAIPVFGVIPGEAPWYMHRPDDTPIKDGRERKYLIPAGRKMALDVHPLVHAGLGDPQYPLFVTEGPKKTDALVSAGAKAVVGLAGVWNWRGTNGDGGKVLLPDWEWVALKEGRRVYVCFDSDVLLKEQVHQACGRLGEALKRMGANVAFVYLPAAANGGKVGVDDFLAQGHSLADVTALATAELRLPPVTQDEDAEGRSIERILKRAKPCPEAVDGARLADDIKNTIRRHIVLTDAQAVAVTLWIFFSWVFDSARVSPLLFVTSPMPECGKTNVLTLVRWLARAALPASNVSGASIYHLIERHELTLVIDEADSFMRDDERIAGIVNSGHTRDLAFVIRMHGEGAAQEPRVFSTWAPKALAGIGVKCLQPATRTRCIVIELERAPDGADYKPLTEVDTIDNPWPDLASRLARWADDFPGAASGPVELDGLARRTADNWRPMFAVADAIAGDWPRLANEAAKELSDSKRVVDEDVKTLLLSDLRDIYGSRDRMHSKDIVEALTALEDRPWAEWGRQSKPITKTGLARLLGDFKVPSPVAMRIHEKNLKGYEREWLEPLFERYLARAGDDEPSRRHNAHHDWENGENTTVTGNPGVTDGNPPDSAPEAGCDGVTDGKPPRGPEAERKCPKCGRSASFTVARDRAYCLPCSWHEELPPEAGPRAGAS
jgi:putative DNA primase/helicase